MRDPSANELDALDRLIVGGLAAGASGGGFLSGGSEPESLARVAVAVRDSSADEAGLNIDRTWARVSAGMRAQPSVGFRARLAGLIPRWSDGQGSRLSLATSSLAAVLVLAIAAVLSIVVLPSGSAEASFLETVDELAAASDAALADDAIDAEEAAQLQVRIDAVVAALQARPEELAGIPVARARAALATITDVRAAIDRAALAEEQSGVQAATAVLVSASVARLDAVAERVAAVVDGPTAAGDDTGAAPDEVGSGDGDAPDGSAGPSRPAAADAADEDRDEPAGDEAEADATPLRPSDRPAAVDDVKEPEPDDDGTDLQDVPLRPSTDAAGDAGAPDLSVDPVRPPTDVAGTDVAGTDVGGTEASELDAVRPVDGTTDVDAPDETDVGGGDVQEGDDDSRPEEDPAVDNEAGDRPSRPPRPAPHRPPRPPAEPPPEDEESRDPDAMPDAAGDAETSDTTVRDGEPNAGSLDASSGAETNQASGEVEGDALLADAVVVATVEPVQVAPPPAEDNPGANSSAEATRDEEAGSDAPPAETSGEVATSLGTAG